MKLNSHYSELNSGYLFTQTGKRIRDYSQAHPDIDVIRLGIGDVTRPLAPAVIAAMQNSVAQMGDADTFRGYGDEQGYLFLRSAVSDYYKTKNVDIVPDEIFISDGAKSDLGNILDIFDSDNTVLIPDPVYPVYVDTNIMAGRKIRFINACEENGFLPLPDGGEADIIYLCSPNNPTGAVYTKAALQKWVDYALERKAVILFDAAYEAFISDSSLPSSIFQIPGAERCAVEFCSFSKTAGFTGTRCGYTVVPKELVFDGVQLSALWLRRQTTKFNGTAYIVQRGAQAVFSKDGHAQVMADIDYYKKNAKYIADALKDLGITCFGGINSPYIWMKCPDNMTSWQCFDYMLEKAHVAGTPGSGFGKNGEGYFRLTAFNTYENTVQATQRLKELFGK